MCGLGGGIGDGGGVQTLYGVPQDAGLVTPLRRSCCLLGVTALGPSLKPQRAPCL